MTLDAGRTAGDLAAGSLCCVSCGGQLAPWGHARERPVWMLGGTRARVRPRRARCRSCLVTVVLLPAWCAPRRAHAVEVIGTAAVAAAAGYRPQSIGWQLGVPASTVRGWLDRPRGRTAPLRDRRADGLRLDHGAARRTGRLGAGRCPGRGRRRHLRRPAADRLRPGHDLGAGGPVRPVPLPAARPRWVIIFWPSRAGPCPRPGRDAHHGHDSTRLAVLARAMATKPPP